MLDTIVRGATAVLPAGPARVNIGIEDGKIAAIEPELPQAACAEIDARGLHVFPAVIDVHLHFNEPGRTDWEGAGTGSRALAAGGGAAFFDMPLNSTPCTVDARAFTEKRRALEAASIADFGLWGGLVPGNVDRLASLAELGAVGFKAFLCDSGLPEFPRADDCTLFRGLQEASRLGLPVAVHAESHELTRGLSSEPIGQTTAVRDFLRSRPVVAEVEAIQRACLLAGEANAKLHIVHISSGRGICAALEARAKGADVSIETCGHYLFFTEEDVERLGAIAKCAPPLRSATEQAGLWTAVQNGDVHIIASDHSPAPPEMKSGDFRKAWGGIAGVQSTLAVLLDQGYARRNLPLERIADLLASTPARRFGLERKGQLRVGYDADLTLVDLQASFQLEPGDLKQRHAISPYLGRSFRGVVRRTMRRGETIFRNGAICAENGGRFLRPRLTS